MNKASFNNLSFYWVEVHTGNFPLAKGRGKIFVKFATPSIETERYQLSTPTGAKGIFKKGKIDQFFIVAPNLGEHLTQITISFEGIAPKWYLEEVAVKVNGYIYYACFQNYIYEEKTIELLMVEEKWKKIQTGRLVIGPILRYRGIGRIENVSTWRIGITFVTEGTHEITSKITYSSDIFQQSFESEVPLEYYQNGSFKMWRYDIEFPLHETLSQKGKYSFLDGKTYEIDIPAINCPPKMFFASCIDKERPYGLLNVVDKNIGWHYLFLERKSSDYNLFILGGDQVYADQIWYASSSLRSWNRRGKSKYESEFSSKMGIESDCFYFFLYAYTWSQDPVQIEVFATIPTVMIWDDHDTFDGWGSYNPEINNSPVMMGVHYYAKKNFFLYQRSGDYSLTINELNPNGPFNTGCILTGGTALLMLDTRTERIMKSHDEGIILSPRSWSYVEDFLSFIGKYAMIKHLFVVLTTPLVYAHSNKADKLMDITNYNLLDDARDHWPAIIHREESRFLLQLLHKFKIEANSRVTILAGDVHCAGYGTVRDLESRDLLFEQIISSGISAEAPPAIGLFLFNHVLRKKFTIYPYRLTVDKLPNGKRLINQNNFLSLIPNQNSFIAKWTIVPLHDEPLIPHALPKPIVLEKAIQ